MLSHFAAAAAICGLLASPVVAQDAAMPDFAGIAVAQAPEAGLGVCLGADAAETMQCAQHECMEQSGLGKADCVVNLWCFPHGWTAQVAVLHTEGIGWSKFICDEMNAEDLDKAVAFYCAKEFIAECAAVRIWDRDGALVLDYKD